MIPELKVPFLHEKQVERAANELLHKYAKDKGKPVRAPIDVENILEGFFKLDLVYIDLPDFIGVADVLGATFIKDQRVFIDESLMIDGKEARLTAWPRWSNYSERPNSWPLERLDMVALLGLLVEHGCLPSAPAAEREEARLRVVAGVLVVFVALGCLGVVRERAAPLLEPGDEVGGVLLARRVPDEVRGVGHGCLPWCSHQACQTSAARAR